jgi:predicted dehydrogenase
MPRVRVGVIGCGLVAQVMHLPNLRELGDRFALRAICDLSPRLLERVGDAFGVERRTGRWEELLDEPLDAVMILSSGSHAAPAIAAAERGLHVFVEKPMCLGVEEGLEMLRAAERAGTTLMVGYMKRYDPAYERLLEELERSGSIRLVLATTLESPGKPYLEHLPLEPPGELPADARALLEASRARDDAAAIAAIGTDDLLVVDVYRRVLLDSLVHDLNLVRGALGEPDLLEFARIRPEGVTAMLVYGDIQVVHTWVDLPGIARYRQEFAFYAPERRATLVFPSPYLRNMPTELVIEEGTLGSPRSWETRETASYDEAFGRELVAFHEAITGGRAPRTPGRDGLRDVALCRAIVAAHLGGSSIARPTALPKP